MTPITELQKATDQVTKGNYDIRVSPKSDDEIGKLAKHFNEMTEHVKQKIVVERELEVNKEIQKKKEPSS